MTRVKRSKLRRTLLAVATLAVLGELAWIGLGVDESSPVARENEAAAYVRTSDGGDDDVVARDVLAVARVEARARIPPRAVVLPENPPPMGLPGWAVPAHTQPDQAMQTPRGER
jgi:hypothetical protein